MSAVDNQPINQRGATEHDNEEACVHRPRRTGWPCRSGQGQEGALAAIAAPFAGEDDVLGEALFRHFDNGAARLEDDCFIVIAGRWAYGYFVSVAPGHVEARVTVIRPKTKS